MIHIWPKNNDEETSAPHLSITPATKKISAQEVTIALQATAINYACNAFRAVEGYMHPEDHTAFVEDWNPISSLDTAGSDATAIRAHERFDAAIATHNDLVSENRSLLLEIARVLAAGASPVVAENHRRMRATMSLIAALGGPAGDLAQQVLTNQIIPENDELWML